jgi:hypothetical protein
MNSILFGLIYCSLFALHLAGYLHRLVLDPTSSVSVWNKHQRNASQAGQYNLDIMRIGLEGEVTTLFPFWIKGLESGDQPCLGK